MMNQTEAMDEVDGAPHDRISDLPLMKNTNLMRKEGIDSGFGSISSNPSDYGSLASNQSLTATFSRLELANKAFSAGKDVSIPQSSEVGYASMEDPQIVSERAVHSLPINPMTQPENTARIDNQLLFIQDVDGDTQLHIAILQGVFGVAKRIIDLAPTPEDLNRQGAQKLTALHLAVLTDQPLLARYLLRAGAILETWDEDGNTPLHLACQHGHHRCVQSLTQPLMSCESVSLLFQRIPQDMEIKNYAGYTCMHLAAQQSGIEALRYLYNAAVGADVNARDGQSGRTVLHHAADVGNAQLVSFLTSQPGVLVDAIAYNNYTPVQLARGRGYEQIVRHLEAAGADANTVESTSESDSSSEEDKMESLDDIQINMYTTATKCT